MCRRVGTADPTTPEAALHVATFITDFADEAVVLPLALAIAIILLALRWDRAAAAWAVCVPGVLGIMLVLKIGFISVGWRLLPWTGLHSPSGHTAAAAVVYGGALGLLMPTRIRGVAASVATSGGIAVLIAVTRLVLHSHDVAEVVLGGLVGVVGAALLVRWAGPSPRARSGPLLACMALAVLVVAGYMHGTHLDTESTLLRLDYSALPRPAPARSLL